MTDWLVIRLPRLPEQPAEWMIADAHGAAVAAPRKEPLSLAVSHAAGRRVVVLVPGSDVLLAEPELPVKAGMKLQQIVPYALEEQLADDIDNLHFAVSKRSAESGRTPVAVVAKALLEEWMTLLRSIGLEPEALYTDSDLLPSNPGQAVAFLEDDIVVVRPVAGVPVTLPVDALGSALELAHVTDELGENRPGGLILYTGAAEWQRYSQQIEAARGEFDAIKVQLLTGGPLPLLCQQLPSTNAVNLLQGAYTPQRSKNVGWQAWRVAAILVACLVGLHLIGKSAELAVLKSREHKVDASIERAFHAVMPGQASANVARQRMEERLNAVRSGGDASGLLATLAAIVQARGSTPGTVVNALSFHDGGLDLKLTAPNADALDRISHQLQANGWQANLTSGSATKTGYQGRIQIRAKGAS